MIMDDLSVYSKNQSIWNCYVCFILKSIDIPQPHPDCQMLYVMGYKEENPAHNCEGSRPAMCVGVAIMDASAAGVPNTSKTLATAISLFVNQQWETPVNLLHRKITCVSVCHTWSKSRMYWAFRYKCMNYCLFSTKFKPS